MAVEDQNGECLNTLKQMIYNANISVHVKQQEHSEGMPTLFCLILVTLRFLYADNEEHNEDAAEEKKYKLKKNT